MNSLVKRGINVYKIFLKNKLAMSIMMFVSGVMMFIAGVRGTGNDTVMMPLGITLAGAILSFWGFYRFGYIKACYDKADTSDEKAIGRATFTLQIVETAVYFIVACVGIFLLINQDFTNKILNIMAGFFTTLNGVFGVIYLVKNHETRDWWFYFKIILTLVELGFGIYFILSSDNIEMGWFIAMGTLTTIAGAIEVKGALTREQLQATAKDGRDIIKIIKDNNQ